MLTAPVVLVGVAALVALVALVLLCGKKKKTPQAASALNMNYLDEVPVSAGLLLPQIQFS